MFRFTALPVNLGDAFLLERPTHRILVDGGNNPACLSSLVPAHIKSSGLDILVCTHNDADHAAGLIGLLNAGQVAKEVWLPGSWLGIIQAAAAAGAELESQMARQLADILEGLDLDAADVVEAIVRNVESEDIPRDRDSREGQPDSALSEFRWPAYVEDWLSGENAVRSGSYEMQVDSLGGPFAAPLYDELFARLEFAKWNAAWTAWRALIRTLGNIESIARMAYGQNAVVRWFEHDPANPDGGIQDLLVPISSRQVYASKTPALLVVALFLSTVNRESLVFHSPADGGFSGVLFCADSDLSGCTLKDRLQGDEIVTAPHHGASANASAYALIESACQSGGSDLTWVRSDNFNRHRPCLAYRSVKGKRSCTVCRTRRGRQPVALESHGSGWAFMPGTLLCGC